MRIETLLELINTKVTTRQNPQPSKGERLGDGAYSTVRKDVDDPHMVRKRHNSTRSAERDGFVKWGEYIIKHKLSDNPHIPRIYNVSKEEEGPGKFVYDYQMEKLTSLSDGKVKPYEIKALWRQHLSKETYPEDAHDMSAEEMMDYLGGILQDALYGDEESLSNITSESLRDAIRHLRNYYQENNYEPHPDIHSENVMLRRTPHGLQLVITDPFA